MEYKAVILSSCSINLTFESLLIIPGLFFIEDADRNFADIRELVVPDVVFPVSAFWVGVSIQVTLFSTFSNLTVFNSNFLSISFLMHNECIKKN